LPRGKNSVNRAFGIFLPNLPEYYEAYVHLAGDHLLPWPDWMNGALQSGDRAAHEVNQAW